jgi:hypothetical protein
MTVTSIARVLAASVMTCAVHLSASQATKPLPDEASFFAETQKNLTRSNQIQYQYAYKERRTELHMNPFGRMGTGEIRLYEVTPGDNERVYFRRLLERGGKPVPDGAPERQERRPTTGRSLADVLATLKFSLARREAVNGRDAIVVTFEPRPDARPQTRQGSIAKVLKGTIWVDEAAREVIRVEATAIDSVSFGAGIVARLHEGATVSLARQRIDDDVWLPTSVRMKGNGRALLLRRVNIDYVIEWFDYRLPERLKSQSHLQDPESQRSEPRPVDARSR